MRGSDDHKSVAMQMGRLASELHAEAASKIKPLAPGEVQCSERKYYAGGTFCCLRSVHGDDQHWWPDPILGLT